MPSTALSPLPPTTTVTSMSSSNVLLFEKAAVTVTTLAPAPSLTLAGFTLRFTADGTVSSSVSVSVAELTVSSVLLPDNVMLSSPSTSVSSSGSSLNVPVALVWPDPILIERSASSTE